MFTSPLTSFFFLVFYLSFSLSYVSSYTWARSRDPSQTGDSMILYPMIPRKKGKEKGCVKQGWIFRSLFPPQAWQIGKKEDI